MTNQTAIKLYEMIKVIETSFFLSFVLSSSRWIDDVLVLEKGVMHDT